MAELLGHRDIELDTALNRLRASQEKVPNPHRSTILTPTLALTLTLTLLTLTLRDSEHLAKGRSTRIYSDCACELETSLGITSNSIH